MWSIINFNDIDGNTCIDRIYFFTNFTTDFTNSSHPFQIILKFDQIQGR